MKRGACLLMLVVGSLVFIDCGKADDALGEDDSSSSQISSSSSTESSSSDVVSSSSSSDSTASAISLSGTVYDADNKAKAGVIIELSSAGLRDTTGSDGTWSLEGAAVLGKKAAATDRLIYSLAGQIITEDEIDSYKQAGIEKWIQEHNITGNMLPDLLVDVDSVYAWISGGTMSTARRAILGFNSQVHAYSGRVYTVKSITGDVYDFKIWLNVYGNGMHKTAVSDTMDFNTNFSGIDFIPEFGAGNALPWVSTDIVKSVLFDDTLLIQINDSRNGVIVDWKIEMESRPTIYGEDSIAYLVVPDTEGPFSILLTYMDNDSNERQYSDTFHALNPSQYFADERDQQNYRKVVIGNQIWMAENLRFDTLSGIGSWHQDSTLQIFGRWYDWTTAMKVDQAFNAEFWNGSDLLHQGICPKSWHLPSNSEWDTLFAYAGTDAGDRLRNNESWSDCGEWNPCGELNFFALPAGSFNNGNHEGNDSRFWTATEDSQNSIAADFVLITAGVQSALMNKTSGLSIRCIKD